MDDVEKLKCNEVVEVSDLENSATDDVKEEEKPKKKKRRRREIDMVRKLHYNNKIKISDDEEEDLGTEELLYKKLAKLGSPGPNSPGHREPRSCVVKAIQKRKPLSRLLEQLLRNLEKRDPNQFFAWPVNDNFAPGYSTIIKKPMDFSSIKQKIDENEYRSLNCFINDFKLMCNNAMKYNKPGTVYHKAARRLLHVGLKQLTPAKLRPLGNILTYMYEIPIRELGFDIGKMDVQRVLRRSVGGSESTKSSGEGEECEPVSDSGERRDTADPGDSVKIKMAEAREKHRKKLARKAFPRMDEECKTTLCLVTDTAGTDANERPITLGQFVGKLPHGTGTLQSYREDRRNLVKGVKPLDYGPFSSFAPTYDSTFATLTKEESHLLYHTLPYEMGNGSEELLRFAPDSPWSTIYDMEQLFPDKKSLPEPEDKDDNDIAKMKVDIEQLRSLSELGIDTDFLLELEEDVAASQRDYGIGPALQHTYQLLARLDKEQRERLSTAPPAHLSLVGRAGGGERELARGAAACLRGMTARVPPRHVAPLCAVRRAMGVTLDHLDTPMSVDEFTELEASVAAAVSGAGEASDLDSRSSAEVK